MPGARGGGIHTPTWLPWLVFLGGHALTLGAASEEQPLPERCTAVEIHAEGGLVYVNINAAAGPGAPVYMPDGGGVFIGPLWNLNSLHLASDAAGAIAHIAFFCESIDLPGA